MLKYVTFRSSGYAMTADRLIDLEGVRLIPLPTKIDAGCGLCLKVEKNMDKVEKILKENKIEYDIYE